MSKARRFGEPGAGARRAGPRNLARGFSADNCCAISRTILTVCSDMSPRKGSMNAICKLASQ
eukprot:1686046-Pyramimonas_sp.AAC.1